MEDDPTSGRKKGGKNKRLRRLFAIDAVHLSELARQYTRDAVKALVKTVRTSKSEAARVCAANALLDRGYGRPPAQVDISTRSREDVVYRSEAELRRAPIDRGLPEAMLPPQLAPSDSFTEGNDD